MLLGWYGQHPVEVLKARQYDVDRLFMDTTHNATTYSFKTGPPSVVDCFGHTALLEYAKYVRKRSIQ